MLTKADQLVGAIRSNDNALRKANALGKLTSELENENDAKMKAVCASLGSDIYDRFLYLKSDFYAQKISLSVYLDYLKKLWDILQTPDVMVNVSELHAQELYDELSKFVKL